MCIYLFLSTDLRLKSVSSVKNCLSGVKTWHQLFDYSTVTLLSNQFKLTIRVICHMNVTVSKLSLLPSLLIDIIKLFDTYDSIDACLLCFLTSLFGMLKMSNVISRTVSFFNANEQLTRKGICLTDI